MAESEISEADRIGDSLPQSLEHAIQRYGLSQFKIKIKASDEEDLPRLEGIASIANQYCPDGYTLSLDGNEQFTSWPQFAEFWQRACSRPVLKDFLQKVVFIEQPLSRKSALQEKNIGRLPDGSMTPPVIIDESDGEATDFETAIKIGYRGTSHKNCKGVFKGIAHRCLINLRNRTAPDSLIMSGEDLGNIGPVAINQDLMLQAILGNNSVERNGHHYFNGLSMFPEAIRKLVPQSHPELYRIADDGVPTLNIERGTLDVAALLETPFGTRYSPEEIFRAFEDRGLE